MTVPTSSSRTSLLNEAICALRRPEISSALIIYFLVSVLREQFAREFFQASGDGTVDAAVAHGDADAADQRRVDRLGHVEFLAVGCFQAGDQGGQFGRAEGLGRDDRQRLGAAGGALQRFVL